MDFSLKGIFTSVFSKKKDLSVSTSKLLNLFTPYFSNTVNPELNDTYMSAVNTHARHLSKIKPGAFLNNRKDKSYLTKILSLKPNPIMEAGAFWEKVCRNYYTENNVFIYLDWDLTKLKAPLKGMWILDPLNIDIRYSEDYNEFFFQFNIQGKIITTSLENIVHIPRHVGDSEIFGEQSPAIDSVLKVINTNYEGLENAIKTSAFLRFVINTTTLMTEKQKEQKAKDFATTYLSKDGTGIAYLDSSSELTQVNSDGKYANADTMKILETKILNYLNISTEILQGNFTEDQWQSYYETNIEPLVNKIQNELTIKIFTDREYDMGNRILISSNDLQVVSTASKIDLLTNSKEIGLFTINEYRHLFNMPPIDEGNNRVVSLNYISSNIADDYQMSRPKPKKEGLDDESQT